MTPTHNIKQAQFYGKIGKNILNARNASGLTQEQLGDKLGMSRVSIGNIETGKQRLPIHVLQDICRILGVTIFDLVNNAPSVIGKKRSRFTLHLSRIELEYIVNNIPDEGLKERLSYELNRPVA